MRSGPSRNLSPTFLIGTSGWHYDHWRERFYPSGLSPKKWLQFYAQEFATVELNNTFYRLPTEQACHAWRETVPPDFIYAVKASRLITHFHKLVGVEEALHTFLQRVKLLGPKLGPILYQLPPDLARDDERLESFLAMLPPEQHHVFEFRNSSWFVAPVFELLRKHGAALCVSDMPSAVSPVVATTDLAYFRFHGSQGVYWGSYSDEDLETWARRIRNLGEGVRMVCAYFNNDVEGAAIRDARRLRQILTDWEMDQGRS